MHVTIAAWLAGATVLCAATGTTPPPTAPEQAAIIEATRTAALAYADHLPDFICTQVTRRWANQNRASSNVVFPGLGGSAPSIVHLEGSNNWKLRDTLTIQLTYSGQKEDYKLLLVNGKPTKQSYESVGGMTVYGDFGSLLGMVFQSSSETQFTWDHWATLDNLPVMVFGFSVDAQHSQWRIGYESQQMITAFKGFVFIDPTQHQVLKIKVNAEEIPSKFPVQQSNMELDYRTQKVGDREFLLPLKAIDWNVSKNVSTKNEVEFHLYRKFSTDSKIDFNTPAPLPESQTKETIPNK